MRGQATPIITRTRDICIRAFLLIKHPSLSNVRWHVLSPTDTPIWSAVLALIPHDDSMQRTPFPHHWRFVTGINRSPLDSVTSEPSVIWSFVSFTFSMNKLLTFSVVFLFHFVGKRLRPLKRTTFIYSSHQSVIRELIIDVTHDTRWVVFPSYDMPTRSNFQSITFAAFLFSSRYKQCQVIERHHFVHCGSRS